MFEPPISSNMSLGALELPIEGFLLPFTAKV